MVDFSFTLCLCALLSMRCREDEDAVMPLAFPLDPDLLFRDTFSAPSRSVLPTSRKVSMASVVL